MAETRTITPRAKLFRVIDLMARMHGSTLDEVRSESRLPHVVQGRMAAVATVWLNLRKPCDERYSASEIAIIFGYGEHSSVLYALRKRGLR